MGGQDLAKQWGDKGIIVGLNRGFGFIRPDTGKVDDRDLFFLASGLNRDNAFDDLQLDDEVTYEVTMDDRGQKPLAKNVTVQGGGGRDRGRKDSRDRGRQRRDNSRG